MLLALSVAPPLVAHATGSVVGAFSMFGHLERYHLEVAAITPAGAKRLPLRALAPHLSRDAKQMLLPAESYAVGADQVRLVAGTLPSIATLACRLTPAATSVRVVMERAAMRGDEQLEQRVERPCGGKP